MGLLEVGRIEPDQLRPAQGRCEPEQQESPVPDVRGVVATGRHHPAEVLGHDRTYLTGGHAMDPPDASVHQPHALIVVGEECPATLWAWAMDTMRREMVDGLKVSAMSVTYKATVTGSAGRLERFRRSHQAAKCSQSAR